MASTLRHGLPRSTTALAAGFLALGLFLMASVVFSVRQQGDDVALRHALEVEVDLGDLQSALLDAEVGQRGYLMTEDKAFLAPYHASSDRLDTLLAKLDLAVRADADQAATNREIRGLVAEKRAEIARTLELHAAGDAPGALALVRSRAGLGLMDRIRTLILRMDEEQDRLVTARQAAMQTIGLATAISTGISLVLMGLVALAALAEVRKRGRLARFLPVEIASRLADGDSGLARGRSGPATIAFIDIRGSTALAETLAPAAVSALLNRFRGAVSAAAARHDGMVDKFIGDGALVVFGALDADAAAPARGLAFASELLARLAPEAGDAHPFRIGIGLHHGEVFCGVVGDADRQEFTVLGDTVNIAARIEEATKHHATELLVSDAVLDAAGVDRGDWCRISCAPLRGRQEATSLWAPASRPDASLRAAHRDAARKC